MKTVDNPFWLHRIGTCHLCGFQATTGPLASHVRYAHKEDKATVFWSKVDRSGGPDSCWPWQGAKHYRGYGACGKRYGDTRAHRVAYKLVKGEIPDGQGVLHRCNNTLCVNPDHLYLGDQKQNMADCRESGRRNHRYTPVELLHHPQLSRRLTGRKW